MHAQTEGDRPRQLLFLSHRLPFPVHNGQSARTYNLLRQLSRAFEVTALCFDNADPSRPDMPLHERMRAIEPFVKELFVVDVPQDRSRSRLLRDHAYSTVTGRPYTWPMYDSAGFSSALRRVLSRNAYALVHLESMDLMRYVDAVGSLPIACTHHNVESELLFRRAASETHPFRRWYIGHQARLVKAAEVKLLERFALNVAVSENDRQSLSELAPRAKVVSVPNGVDVDYFDPTGRTAERRGSAFVGGTNWYPNRDALEWYSAEILPLLRARSVDPATRWVGFSRPDEVQRFSAGSALQLVGFVDDLRDELSATACFIVPLRVGGGTRLKVLEAWAMGCAVVSTSIGCEGLDARDGENILIADTARDFATQMERVLSDPVLGAQLGKRARETAAGRYGWSRLGEQLIGHYLAAAG